MKSYSYNINRIVMQSFSLYFKLFFTDFFEEWAKPETCTPVTAAPPVPQNPLTKEEPFSQIQLITLVNAKHPKQAMLPIGSCYSLIAEWYQSNLGNENFIAELNSMISTLQKNGSLSKSQLERIETLNALQFEQSNEMHKILLHQKKFEDAIDLYAPLKQAFYLRQGNVTPLKMYYIPHIKLSPYKVIYHSVEEEYFDLIRSPLRVEPSAISYYAMREVNTCIEVYLEHSNLPLSLHLLAFTCRAESANSILFQYWDPNNKLVSSSNKDAIEASLKNLLETHYSTWKISNIFSTKPYHWQGALSYRLTREFYMSNTLMINDFQFWQKISYGSTVLSIMTTRPECIPYVLKVERLSNLIKASIRISPASVKQTLFAIAYKVPAHEKSFKSLLTLK